MLSLHKEPLFHNHEAYDSNLTGSWSDPEKAFRRRKRTVGKSWRMDESVSRTRAKASDAVLKMGVGLPKSACRGRLQTARCCCVQKAWW
ncbi:hypothetical protein EVC45_30185 [Paraburkholderia sp. UYCP14C]|nr:hypothetical protein EVC45_30185 [Paraburkholderia sp. UYCP14C]